MPFRVWIKATDKTRTNALHHGSTFRSTKTHAHTHTPFCIRYTSDVIRSRLPTTTQWLHHHRDFESIPIYALNWQFPKSHLQIEIQILPNHTQFQHTVRAHVFESNRTNKHRLRVCKSHQTDNNNWTNSNGFSEDVNVIWMWIRKCCRFSWNVLNQYDKQTLNWIIAYHTLIYLHIDMYLQWLAFTVYAFESNSNYPTNATLNNSMAANRLM